MTDRRLQWPLRFLRVTVFVVMLMWMLDKFVHPDHAAKVFEHFYFIGGLGAVVMRIIGAIEPLVIFTFVAGLAKRWSYGLVLALHAVSTLSSFRIHLDPFNSPKLLCFAAWPMLAACVTLFLLRDEDRLASLG